MTESERFEAKVNKADGCWLWTGGLNRPDGYGSFYYNGRSRPAHRFAFEQAYGPIPAGFGAMASGSGLPCSLAICFLVSSHNRWYLSRSRSCLVM
jgi:hypothetical protein